MEDIHDRNDEVIEHPHRHSYYTVIWCNEGKGTHHIDFQTYPVTDHSLFFVSPDQVHQVKTEGKPNGVVLLFTPMFLDRSGIGSHFISDLNLFRDCGVTPPLKVSPGMGEELQNYIDGMWKSYESNDAFKLDRIGAFLKLFLIRCNEEFASDSVDQSIEVAHGTHIVREFKAKVDQHFRKEHSVNFYSDALHITANYLNEVISMALGLSAKQYITHRIILEAKREALFTDHSSKEVGYSLGFDDPSAFSKFFKKHAECSFSDFRRDVRHAA